LQNEGIGKPAGRKAGVAQTIKKFR
jgi:hypothetical protein